MPAQPDPDKTFASDWPAASLEVELARWSDFLARHRVPGAPDDEARRFAQKALASGSPHAGRAIGIRFAHLANTALTAAGDPRRVAKLATGSTWVLVTPEERAALEQGGVRLEVGAEGIWRSLATIPITLGAFFASQYACRAAGLDENLAWVVALVVYVLVVRVVRGRWPLQRPA